MLKRLKSHLRNDRGLTLIELLAVVVILGIIAAIAVPSIGGLINNSKKDAHIANAMMIRDAARLAVTSEDFANVESITLGQLITNGYLEKVEGPSGSTYDTEKTIVTITKDDNGTFTFRVTLVGSKFTIAENADAATAKRSDITITKETTEPPVVK